MVERGMRDEEGRVNSIRFEGRMNGTESSRHAALLARLDLQEGTTRHALS